MKVLLIVNRAKDVFCYSLAKWLKEYLGDQLILDIFETSESSVSLYNDIYSDKIITAKSIKTKVPYFSFQANKWYAAHQVEIFLKDKQYDIIHVHWLNTPIVLTKGIKKHCKYLVTTFWGGELNGRLELLGSKSLYRKKLNRFMKQVDYNVNSESFIKKIEQLYPNLKDKCFCGDFGSACMDYIYEITQKLSKKEAKKVIGVTDPMKTTIQIGYSGKVIHQHIAIIKELKKYPKLKDKIHIIAPMTRDAQPDYVNEVEKMLRESDFTFTVLKGKFLSDKEIAFLRYATDITLQFSVSDGFSRSLIEAMAAKSIVIYGTWLYDNKMIQDLDFKMFPTESIEDGIKLICNIIDDGTKYDDYICHNQKVGLKYTWKNCIKEWGESYKKILNVEIH